MMGTQVLSITWPWEFHSAAEDDGMGWELSRTKPVPTFCQPRSPKLSANGAGERRPVVCPGRQGFQELWTQSLISVTVGPGLCSRTQRIFIEYLPCAGW